MKSRIKKTIYDVTDGLYYQPVQMLAEHEDGRQHTFLGQYIDNHRYVFLFTFICICFMIIISKVIFLQVIKGDDYFARAEGNRAKTKIIPFSRGLIYDSDGDPLVRNEPVFDVTLVPSQLPLQLHERQQQVYAIAELLDMDPLALTDILKNYSALYLQPVVIKSDIPYEESLTLNTRFESFPELALDIRTQRVYSDRAFSHILGYIGKINEQELEQGRDDGYLFNDVIGKNGLELSYEKVLRGEYGHQEIEIDSAGRIIKVLSQRPPKHGDNIQLTIDADFQDTVFKMTREYLKSVGKRKASVVVMDPRSGAVRALVSYPEYNNNDFSGGISQETYDWYLDNADNPLFDRTLKGEYPPGSTIKMLVGAAALQENVITASTGFWSTGGLLIANLWFFPDWRAGGHGYTTIKKALADSVNTFFYIVGGGYEDFVGLGLDRLVEYYRSFGLGAQTGIDIPGERPGLVPTREWKWEKKHEEWYIGDTYHMSIGQGDVLVTPLQVALYTSYFANGSRIYIPHVVKSIIDAQGVRKELPSRVFRENIIDPFNTKIIREGLRASVTEGSARFLLSLPVTVAGKTGTAQFAKNKEPHAWFTGFAPYKSPEIVVTVLVEEGGEGSVVAVPLARQIIEYYFGAYQQELSLPQEN